MANRYVYLVTWELEGDEIPFSSWAKARKHVKKQGYTKKINRQNLTDNQAVEWYIQPEDNELRAVNNNDFMSIEKKRVN